MEAKLQRIIGSVEDWGKINKMVVNTDETKLTFANRWKRQAESRTETKCAYPKKITRGGKQ